MDVSGTSSGGDLDAAASLSQPAAEAEGEGEAAQASEKEAAMEEDGADDLAGTTAAVAAAAAAVSPYLRWRVGSRVSTTYGEGVVQAQRPDGSYQVQLPFGVAFLRASAVVFSSSSPTGADASAVEASDLQGTSVADLHAADAETLTPAVGLHAAESVVYGPASLYVFLRLYHALTTRLQCAKNLCYEGGLNRGSQSAHSVRCRTIV